MLAYVLFLVCCLLIYPVWDSATAQSIITGIAIAGACFSLADLFYCIQDMKNASVAKQQELYLMTIKVIRDGEERVKSLRSKVNTIKPADVQAENADVFEKGKDVIERLEKAITEMEPKTKETSIWGNVFNFIRQWTEEEKKVKIRELLLERGIDLEMMQPSLLLRLVVFEVFAGVR